MEETVEKRLERLEEKIDQILDLLQKEVRPNCKKMGNHIDFVENENDLKEVIDYIRQPVSGTKFFNPVSEF